jgi:hypothetical protein
MASRAADTAGILTHTPHTQWFISQLDLTVSSQEYLKELRILLFQRALYKLPSRDVLKKGNYNFFFLITIYASNLYMPTLIKKKTKFSSYIGKFRVEQLQSHI